MITEEMVSVHPNLVANPTSPLMLPADVAPCMIVKLGGAAITDKQRLETLDRAVLTAAAQHLAQALFAPVPGGGTASSSGTAPCGVNPLCPLRRCVVVHGAGSFGHQEAARHGVARGGWQSDATVLRGFVLTRLSVTKLNHAVVTELVRAGLPAVSMSPFGSWSTRERTVESDACPAVAHALAAGLLPVLHGDCVPDAALGCTVLGGDPIMASLARALRPAFALFLTNVDGVFTRPPHLPGARLLREIGVDAAGGWHVDGAAAEMDLADGDVTGGIAAKVAEAAQIVAAGVPVLIARAGSEHARLALQLGLAVLERGEAWRGTVVRVVAAGGHAAAGGGEAGPQCGRRRVGGDAQAANPA